jgi:hypothetical protein
MRVCCATRPGIPPVPRAEVHALAERTQHEPPSAVTRRTGRAMAKAMGLCMRMIAEVIASAFASGLSWEGTLAGKKVYSPQARVKGRPSNDSP